MGGYTVLLTISFLLLISMSLKATKKRIYKGFTKRQKGIREKRYWKKKKNKKNNFEKNILPVPFHFIKKTVIFVKIKFLFVCAVSL